MAFADLKSRDEIRQAREIADAHWAEGKLEGRAEGWLEGKAEGKLEAGRATLLRLLTRAGLTLTDDEQGRIEACTDTAILDRWIDNVFGAKSAADVFA